MPSLCLSTEDKLSQTTMRHQWQQQWGFLLLPKLQCWTINRSQWYLAQNIRMAQVGMVILFHSSKFPHLTNTTNTAPLLSPTLGPQDSLPCICSINRQQHEKADTNKGDLAQRDAERWLSLGRSEDQSRDLTERDSKPLVHWQQLY